MNKDIVKYRAELQAAAISAINENQFDSFFHWLLTVVGLRYKFTFNGLQMIAEHHENGTVRVKEKGDYNPYILHFHCDIEYNKFNIIPSKQNAKIKTIDELFSEGEIEEAN